MRYFSLGSSTVVSYGQLANIHFRGMYPHVPVQSKEGDPSCICVSGVSILRFSPILELDFGTGTAVVFFHLIYTLLLHREGKHTMFIIYMSYNCVRVDNITPKVFFVFYI